MRIPFYLLLVSILITSCRKGESDKIVIEVTSCDIKIEGKKIKQEEFEVQLENVVDSKLEYGLKKEDLVVRLMVDPETKRGQVADIETAMRKLNIRKVLYSVMSGEEKAR